METAISMRASYASAGGGGILLRVPEDRAERGVSAQGLLPVMCALP